MDRTWGGWGDGGMTFKAYGWIERVAGDRSRQRERFSERGACHVDTWAHDEYSWTRGRMMSTRGHVDGVHVDTWAHDEYTWTRGRSTRGHVDGVHVGGVHVDTWAHRS